MSRIVGQAQKIENPDNLPEEHLRGATPETTTQTLCDSTVPDKFGKNGFAQLTTQKSGLKLNKLNALVCKQPATGENNFYFK